MRSCPLKMYNLLWNLTENQSLTSGLQSITTQSRRRYFYFIEIHYLLRYGPQILTRILHTPLLSCSFFTSMSLPGGRLFPGCRCTVVVPGTTPLISFPFFVLFCCFFEHLPFLLPEVFVSIDYNVKCNNEKDVCKGRKLGY